MIGTGTISLGRRASLRRLGMEPVARPGARALTTENRERPRSIDVACQTPGQLDGALQEALVVCHARILAALAGQERLTIATCSAVAGEGKTTVALALAEMLARDFPRQTLLVDGCLRSPRLHSLFAMRSAPGMTECLTTGTMHLEAVRWSGTHWLMTSGQPLTGGENVGWEEERNLLHMLKQMFRVTVVDLPATLPNAQDVATIATSIDRLVWVVEANSTPAGKVLEAMQIAGRDKVLGVVLNKSRPALPGWLRRLSE